MRNIECDVLIIGGGCAGLSLGYEYAKIKSAGLSVCILEKRGAYHDDRTWCFWLAHQQSFAHRDIILNSWKAWRFSSKTQSHIHRSDSFSYCYISPLAFYQKTIRAIEQDSRQTLILDQDVTAVQKNGQNYKIKGPKFSAIARHVIDTRPYSANELIEHTQVFQIFSGVEIETPSDVFDPDIVGLMDDIQCGEEACHFRYLLPFTKRRALIETTSFSNKYFPPADLDADLQCYLDGLQGTYKVIRREQGVLPMGINHPLPINNGIIVGGMKSDNLKPSSGYGFLRTQIWASQMAKKMCTDTLDRPIDQSAYRMINFFDYTFLRVLNNNINLAEDIFLSIGKNMSPDSFARFMSDKASLTDFVRLIAVVPKQPFIKAVLK